MIKKIIALLTMTTITIGSITACNNTQASKDNTVNSSTDKKNITISFLNTKGEIQTALEEMSKEFEQATGIKVDIMPSGSGESPYTKITSSYNAGTPPTMAMLDTTDIIALADTKAVDLSDEKWVLESQDMMTKINDKVYSFPFCVEGRGLIYNKSAIEKTLGESFDSATINSYDSLSNILQKLRDKGMENPVVISKEDWSLGAHQLQYIYETFDGTNAGTENVINELKDGSKKINDFPRYSQFIDTLDLLLKYNINSANPLGAIYEQDPIYLVDGEAAFWFNGCWAWPNLLESGAQTTDEYGFIPYVLGNDTNDFANTKIQAGPSKQVMIDKVKASDEEIQAAKDFLNWIVYDEAGQKSLVEKCAVISPFKNNTIEPLDPLGADIKSKMDDNKTFIASAIVPGDHWNILGAEMQKYIAGKSSKDELATAIDKYWSQQK